MKRVLAISIILGGMISVQAQSNIKFNLHADPQFSWFSSDEETVEPDGSVFHLQAGLHMDYFFAENYAFTLGLGINNLGGNLLYADSTEFSSGGETLLVEPVQSVKLNLQYLDIPVGLKLKTEELGYSTFFFQLGFNPMFNLNGKATSNEAFMDKEDIRDNIHLFHLAYHAGLGVEYKLGGSTAFLGGIRWTSGLTDVTKNDRANVKINTVSIHLGILF
ncbi:MAG: porin family protein [Bacteroidales bacterium]|nr:porin family protein [Bacteroidales bacterium]